MTQKKFRVLMVHPLPPPWAGVEQIGRSLSRVGFGPEFDLSIIKANIRDSNADKGAWDASGIARVLLIWLRIFFRSVFHRPDLAYLPISQNHSGLMRDSAFILVFWLLRIPVVGHFHGSRLREFLAGNAGALSGFYRFFLDRLKNIVVCAHFIKDDLEKIFPGEKLAVVYNGISLEDASSAGEKTGGPLRVAFMGHLSRAKGFYDLLQAADDVLKAGLDVHFSFAGERLDQERNVPELAGKGTGDRDSWDYFERLQGTYPGRFTLAGMVTGEEKRNFFEGSDVFAFPSRAESFGLSAFEAMSHGLPVIGTPVGALGELLTSGEHGWICPIGRPDALVGALREAAANRGRLQEMGEKNRKLAGALSDKKMAETLSTLFKNVLGAA